MKPVHVAIGLLVLCAVALWQVTVIPESLMQMTVGPVLAASAVAIGLTVVSLLYGLSALRGRQIDESHEPDQSALPGRGARLLYLLAGGVVFGGAVTVAGFVLPATVCGMLVARAFDAPVGLRSLAVCGGIAVAFWVLFALILGVGLGPALTWGI